jgi:hypothetical protein
LADVTYPETTDGAKPFTLDPRWVAAGLVVAVLSIILLLGVWFYTWKKNQQLVRAKCFFLLSFRLHELL